MATTFHIQDRKDPLRFLPKSIRGDVRLGLTIALGIACVSLILLLAQHN